MRFIYVYLVAYFLLIAGAAIALWRGGVLARLSSAWTLLAFLVVVGCGLLLAVASARPTRITSD